MAEPVVVCLTPVRNEEWILDRFLDAAALWADHIVVADQASTDGSREIARRHPKVTLVENPSPEYDERARQALLVDAARQLTGEPRVLIALDADEALAASAFAGARWAEALASAPGTALRWRWANILPGGARAWVPPAPLVFGLVDDGRSHSGPRIHSVRVPVRDDAPTVDFDDSVVLHLQYLDWELMKSKQAWYQCWETLQDPRKRPAALYRQYHHMDAIPHAWIQPVEPSWLEAYRRRDIDLTRAPSERPPWWDRQILDWFAEFGPHRFAKLDLWGTEWTERARDLGHPLAVDGVRDPRTLVDRAVSKWLRMTQRRADARLVRLVDRALRVVGW